MCEQRAPAVMNIYILRGNIDVMNRYVHPRFVAAVADGVDSGTGGFSFRDGGPVVKRVSRCSVAITANVHGRRGP